MRKSTILLAVIILFIFFLSAVVQAEDSFKRFTLKLSGGIGNSSADDMRHLVEGLNTQIEDLAAVTGFTKTGGLEYANWGTNVEAEIVLRLSRSFGIGLGVGFLKRGKESSIGMELASDANSSFSWAPEFRAIPISMSGYYFLSVAPRLNVFLKAGLGYYFARLKYRVREENALLGILEWNQSEGTTRDSDIGFHGGLGIEYSISGNIAFYAEGIGRSAIFNNWKVNDEYTDSTGEQVKRSGMFWYSEEFMVATNKYYANIQLSEQEPSYPWLKNVRKARFSFSGFTIRVGIRIGLGK